MRTYKSALIACILVVFSCIGLARFSFGMVLPNMQIDLNLNTTQIGLIGSANFLGYLLGLFFTGKFYTKFGPATLIKRSLLTQSFCMLLMATSNNYILTSLIFCVAGFFGAMSNIAVMTYITQIVPKAIKGKATGIVVMGIGSSIIFSGIVVPLFDKLFDVSSWRISWLSFALIIFTISFIIKKGLSFPLHVTTTSTNSDYSLKKTFNDKRFLQVACIYLLFGVTYVAYMTFFVLAAEVKWQVSTEVSGIFWTLIGIASLLCGPIFGAIADKIGNYKTLSLIFLIQILAHAILSFDSPITLVWFSALLFGISAWGVPTIMAVLSSELFGIAHTAKILSFVTIFFAIGQIVGPVGAGYIVDELGDFSYTFLASTFLAFLGFLLSFWVDYKHKKSIIA
ncbi:MAG TPA: YbfB/YjiJ family MFS transporter [Sulfurospirillum arcachonense]|nr:YbfB/YjiJ family MFS transporter [Sulfurospirillum arcachonense]HIP43814.1 YbfB/YjiJ family MFS transporter [Sulfurospirillum arcachonense]